MWGQGGFVHKGLFVHRLGLKASFARLGVLVEGRGLFSKPQTPTLTLI